MSARVRLTKEVRVALNAYAQAYAAWAADPSPSPEKRAAMNEAWTAARVVVLRNIDGADP